MEQVSAYACRPQSEGGSARKQAADFGRSHSHLRRLGFPLLSMKQVNILCKTQKRLGQGLFSTAYLVRWHGADAVIKRPNGNVCHEQFIREFKLLRHLQGAGGAP